MTTLAVVCVYDTVANLYGSPFCTVSDKTAIRQFLAETNAAPTGALQTSPQDFILFQLGTYDDATGRHALFDNPLFLIRGKLPDAVTPQQ